ncbi:MAG: hypothetical protein WC107_06195 [Patescibacteria group bacterium]
MPEAVDAVPSVDDEAKADTPMKAICRFPRLKRYAKFYSTTIRELGVKSTPMWTVAERVAAAKNERLESGGVAWDAEMVLDVALGLGLDGMAKRYLKTDVGTENPANRG